ncbi:MAG: caspase family protein [Campylobacterota bacterium]|nr:caspase family protein [Campylobacterota bacterium]
MRYLFLCIMVIVTLEAQSKVALVIGNQNYSSQTQLKNPISDAKLIKKTLESLNFKVLEVYDVDMDKLDRQISKFSTEAKKADVAVLFYAGHGIGVDGKNYAIPIDTHNLSKENLPRKLISLNELQTTVAKASKFGVVFFDACRNSFSTQAGTLAKDDVDGSKHSPYAIALLEKLKLQKDIRLVMGSVKDRVQELTNNVQVPIDRSSLGGDEFLLSFKNDVSLELVSASPVVNSTMESYENSCKHKSASACYATAVKYRDGVDTPKNLKKSLEFFKKSCALDDKSACTHAGWMYKHGEGVKVDNSEAYRFYQKACTLGEGQGCSYFILFRNKYC